MNKLTNCFKYLILILSVILCFLLSIFFGAEKINLNDLIHNYDSVSRIIFFEIRLPRSLLVLITGSLLASSSAIFQLYFRNYLAEPGLLGISSGATACAVFSQALNITTITGGLFSAMNFFAMLGALASGFILTAIASFQKKSHPTVILLLCGTALGTLYSAITSILILFKSTQIQGIYSWLMGSFSGKGWTELKFLFIPAFLSLTIMFFLAPSLDILNSGEQNALCLGVNIRKIKILVIFTASIAISVCVCAGGTIGFIGLTAPNITRKIFGPKAKTLILSSSLCGACILCLADLVSRILIAPAEIPCGIITAFIGVPFFLSLIFKSESCKG